MLLENPRGKRGRKRTHKVSRYPGGLKIPGLSGGKSIMGIKPVEVIAAMGGLAAASMIPSIIIKTPTTTTNKLIKVALSFGVAVVIGGFTKSIVGQEGAKAATFGALAGAGAQTINAFVPSLNWFKLSGNSPLALPMRMGTADLVSSTRTRDGENVAVIQP